jgi:hypothetical protein
LTVQGILRDASSVPVEASTQFRFELLDGTTAVWMEQTTLTPRAGLFTVTLGSTMPIDPTFFSSSLSLRMTVNGEVMAPIPLTSVPYAMRAEVAESYDGDVSWGQLTGVPGGFADGTDDGAAYSAGTGLTLTGSTFAIDPTTVQSRVAGVCPTGSSIRAIAADGSVMCETDDVGTTGATYMAGLGLALTGTTFAIDPTMAQLRVSGVCPAGAAIRSVASDGTVTCETDDDTTYSAGAGLALAGTTFSVDPATVQSRVTGTCAAGSSIRAIAMNGTVTCETDDTGGSSIVGRNIQANARATCQAILAMGESTGDGLYWIDPDGGATTNAFLAHCDMTTEAGGWTLVMNVHPADGNIASFTNTAFWMAEAEYGQIGNHFTHDYKGPAAWLVAGTNIMVQVANPGPEGRMLGYRAWSMPARSFDVFFDAAPNTVQTTAVIGSNVANVYLYEPLIRNGMQLVANRMINPNNDRVRLGVSGYPLQGDDNQPGLGTQMNEAICGVGNNCYRYRDVELWVNSGSNLWCTTVTGPGTYAWIGTDGGCGPSCISGSASCDDHKGGPYSPYWTYRIYVR